MPVGTTSDFDITRIELIDLALGMIGESDPSQSDRSLALKVLNLLIRHLDNRGDWLHAISNTESTLTLVANQQAYAAGSGASLIATNIIKLEYVAVVIGTRRYQLDIIDKPTSLRTTLQDDTTGQPIQVHLEVAKLRASQRMLFYPTPSSAYSVVYKHRRPLYDFDTASDNPDFPSQYALAITKQLASELAPFFGIPLQERQELLQEMEKTFNEAKVGNAESPAYLPVRTEYY